jgi:hypothetical protein
MSAALGNGFLVQGIRENRTLTAALPFPMSILFPTGTAGLVGLANAATLALFLLIFFTLLLIPSLFAAHARPEGAAKALYCYLLQGIGILLMTVSGFPAVTSVLSGTSFSPQSYLFLLLVFAAGGLTFLWHERVVASVDIASRAVPSFLYHYALRLLGFFAVLLGIFSVLSPLLSTPFTVSDKWWTGPLVLLLYGIFLLWATRTPASPPPFRAAPIRNGVPERVKKLVIKKKKK